MTIIEEFLAATELDDAAGLAFNNEFGDVGAIVSRVLGEWSDRQAIANLIMFPSVVVDAGADHVAAIERALDGVDDYLRLAAFVGVARLETMSDAVAVRVGDAIIDAIAERRRGPLAEQASALLDTLPARVHASVLVPLLDHPSDVVRHNLIVAMIGALGPVAAPAELRAMLSSGRIPIEAVEEVDAACDEVQTWITDGNADRRAVIMSSLGSTSFPFVPNLEHSGL